jgi:2,4-dienoyl-CoA reductase-like NADH-dependent reductase (Old Yellow Enzyme family)
VFFYCKRLNKHINRTADEKMFDSLLQPVTLGPTRLRNRIFNPPHGTTLGRQGVVTDDLIAYHLARARGGVGLIIMESMTVHPSYGFEEAFLYAGSDRIVEGLNRLALGCREQGTPVFGQLFHAGRGVRLSHDGSRPLSYSASDMPDERYRVVPVPMPNDMVWAPGVSPMPNSTASRYWPAWVT